MAQSNDVEALRDWLRTCPAIDRAAPFGVDYLGAEAGCWAILWFGGWVALLRWGRKSNASMRTMPQAVRQRLFFKWGRLIRRETKNRIFVWLKVMPIWRPIHTMLQRGIWLPTRIRP